MSLSKRLEEYVRACFSGIWISSHEHVDAILEISQLCQRENWQLATWNIASGLCCAGQPVEQEANDPLAAVQAAGAMAAGDETTVFVLENFHRFLQSAEIVQAIARQVISGKQSRVILVILSPVLQLPAELEKLFVVIDHELPTREQLREIATAVATEPDEIPDGESFERALDAATGLTRFEAENAFALSLVRQQRLDAKTLWQQKSQMLIKAGTLQLYRGDADFDSLGGLSALKAFTRRALRQSSRDNALIRPRGVLLLSPPGCGKSEFCKALGREVGRPVLQLDIGSLMGSLVGQSEERTRQALQVVDAMAACILVIDEADKAFAGVGGSGANDSGVSSRMFGTFLSWLNDHESDVFVVCTSNDASRLPPEFSRSERFDGVFFVDLPGREQKDAIWTLYLELFSLDTNQRRPADENWTGAEIRSCCRLAALLDVPVIQAANNVVPVAVTSAESIEGLRRWASGRCLDADRSGTYQHQSPRRSTRRKVSRSEPSEN
ncbi:AAA family ATPase [Stieleria sp. TO1_6]|uniref:AAA family ATPase n=1 Tax=Stieleria tagensis TaxID=2956795 RepID=UPI00209B3673|nr:AAA family ATPase [Stieleria tagensis]MCO8123389.1 AAA family ATPase [Stieleria tagensis]